MSEELESKVMNVTIDETTGENKILGNTDNNKLDDFDKEFNNIANKINNSEDDVYEDTDPLEEKDVADYLSNNNNDKIGSALTELAKESNVSKEAIVDLLKVVNRRIAKENFNMYRELPDEIREMIDNYINGLIDITKITSRADINKIKKDIAESLIDEFINNIKFDKARIDFATEMNKMYTETNEEIAKSGIEIIECRNSEYRKAAEQMEDEEKKAKLLSIIDVIDGARVLEELKAFATKSKIKKIQLEKPKQTYNDFLLKYKDSTNNIYNIESARKILARHLKSERDADIFLISFCNQVRLYNINDMLKHAYMYYVLYYCATLDGDKNNIFINNVKEVIANAKTRNNL